jgi:hypothetical protein
VPRQSEQLQDQYNAEYPAYAKDCLEEDNSGATRLLTGQTLTKEQMAELEAKKKERDARCKPKADRLAQLQRDILAAQQITNASTAIAHLLTFLLPPAIIAISDAAVRTTEPEMKKFAPTTPSNPISAVAQLRTFSTIAVPQRPLTFTRYRRWRREFRRRSRYSARS